MTSFFCLLAVNKQLISSREKKYDNKPVLLVNSSKLGKAPWEWLRNLDMELLEPTTSTPGWLFPIWSDFFLFIKLELNLFFICLVTEDFLYFSWTAEKKRVNKQLIHFNFLAFHCVNPNALIFTKNTLTHKLTFNPGF